MSDRPAAPRESFGETVRRLSSAQKPALRGAPPYSVYINRRVGRVFAAAAFRAGLTPNAVTAISAVFTYTGIVLIAAVPPSLGLGIAIWLLLAIGYALDSADGQVARLRGGGSLAGEWLDHVVDSGKIVSLHLAVLIAAYRWFELPSDALLLIPIGFTIVAVVHFFATLLNDLLKTIRRLRVNEPAEPANTDRSALRSLLGLPMDYGVLCTSFILLGWVPGFFVVYTLLFACTVVFLAAALAKWFRDMTALT